MFLKGEFSFPRPLFIYFCTLNSVSYQYNQILDKWDSNQGPFVEETIAQPCHNQRPYVQK